LLEQADPALRREVESLLAQPESGELPDRPVIENLPELLEDATVTGLAWGACLGPYRIESKLGEGGMGEVFRAVVTRLGRAVAVKVTQQQFSARFEREARAIASLNHPNICTLYDVGPNYLVMELVEGETLAARLARIFALRRHSIHKQNAGHRLRIHNMVSAPAAPIVFQQGMSKSAHRALPGDTETTMKIHQEIG
jgi:serine/threonine protein kinase